MTESRKWYFVSTRNQEQLPRRLPAFQISMGLCRLIQRINVLDPQLEFAVANHREHRPARR